MKRAFDFLLAVVLLVPATIVVALAAVAVSLDSPGPPIFRQQRVGKDRKPFILLKLRTMRVGTASAASHEVSPRVITRVGAFLRRTKIDELPQIWSVLAGDMSFVGPRPCLLHQTDLIEERDRAGAYRVRPGITGPAQIAGVDMSTPQLLATIDADYAANRSLRCDVVIMLKTLSGRGRGDAVKWV
jgi:O-antigen biosynthesis protein WbqP